MTQVSTERFFADMSILTMADWRSITREELSSEYNIELSSVFQISDLMVSEISDTMLATRYSWKLAASDVEIRDIHVYVFDDKTLILERHYRIRGDERL
jgi:hypothetical protein